MTGSREMADFKIVKMFFGDQERISPRELTDAVRDLPTRSNWHGVQVSPDAGLALDGVWQFPRLAVGWSPEGDGYLVQCSESVDSRSHLLVTGAPFSEPEILTTIGFLSMELWPVQCFVPYQKAPPATLHFVETGSLDPSLDWVGLSEFPGRATITRLPPSS